MDDSDDIDEDEWERWMKLSEKERDQELQTSMREHNEWWDSLTPKQQYRVKRARWLHIAKRWKWLYKEIEADYFKDRARKAQIELIKIRLRYYKGVISGEA